MLKLNISITCKTELDLTDIESTNRERLEEYLETLDRATDQCTESIQQLLQLVQVFDTRMTTIKRRIAAMDVDANIAREERRTPNAERRKDDTYNPTETTRRSGVDRRNPDPEPDLLGGE